MSQQCVSELEKPHLSVSAPRPAACKAGRGRYPQPVLNLQRALGNQRVAQLIQAKRLTPEGRIIGGGISGVQPKLTVGAADDQYEQEADRVSRQVMGMSDIAAADSLQRASGIPEEKKPEEAEKDKDKLLQASPLGSPGSLGAAITPLVHPQPHPQCQAEEEPEKEAALQRNCTASALQRQAEPDEEEAEPVQAKSGDSLAQGFEAGEEVESQLNRSKGGGSALPEPVRAFMEPRFGMDFSQVRVHTGNKAIQMNQDVGAKAFTHGSDIYYGAGSNPDNLELTAHELTHVIQQNSSVPRGKGPDTQKSQYQLEMRHETSLQRMHLDAADRKVFDCSEFVGDKKLEACLNDEDRLRPSDRSNSVAKIQGALLRDGMDLRKHGADGIYGSETAQAVMAFKKKHRLGFEQFPDVGPGTMAKLDQLCLPGPQPSCPPCPEEPRTPGCPTCAPVGACPQCPETPRTAGCPPCSELPDSMKKVCGPDVSAEITRIWNQVRTDFATLTLSDQLNTCRLLIQPITLSGGKLTVNQDDFDTFGLFQGSVSYLRNAPYFPKCGIPGTIHPGVSPSDPACIADPGSPGCAFDPAHEDDSGCSNTVAIGSECWLSGTPNYGAFGIMMKICSDRTVFVPGLHDLFSDTATAALAGGFKIFKGDNPVNPVKWALATYASGPSARVSGGNRPNCKCTCPVPLSNRFDYVWEPNKPRSGAALP